MENTLSRVVIGRQVELKHLALKLWPYDGQRDHEDLYQEAATIALRTTLHLDEAGAFAWVIAIMRNKAREWRRAHAYRCNDRWNAEARRQLVALIFEQLNEFDLVRIRHRIDRALSQMSQSERVAIVARYIGLEPMSYPDLGHLLGCSANAAKMRVSRALVRLKEILGDDDPTPNSGRAQRLPLSAGESLDAYHSYSSKKSAEAIEDYLLTLSLVAREVVMRLLRGNPLLPSVDEDVVIGMSSSLVRHALSHQLPVDASLLAIFRNRAIRQIQATVRRRKGRGANMSKPITPEIETAILARWDSLIEVVLYDVKRETPANSTRWLGHILGFYGVFLAVQDAKSIRLQRKQRPVRHTLTGEMERAPVYRRGFHLKMRGPAPSGEGS